MPFYMFQARYTPESMKALIQSPSDREAAARAVVEAAGGKLHQFFFCFGSEDVLAISEIPDDTAAASVAFVLGASGVLSAGASTKLLTSAEAQEAMKAAGQIAGRYRAPAT